MKKEEDIVSQAIRHFVAESDGYYEKYTKEMLKLIKAHYPLSEKGFGGFDHQAKIERAILSQGIGASSKNGKGLIIMSFAHKMSQANDLDMSLREAQAVITHAAGRCVAKYKLTGLFNRESNSTAHSLFFVSERADTSRLNASIKYKERVLSHPLVVELEEKINEFDLKKPKTVNPYQSEIDRAIKSYKN